MPVEAESWATLDGFGGGQHHDIAEDPMDVFQRLSVSKPALAAICGEFGVRELCAFGSVLRNDFGEQSDVDLLVEFDLGLQPSLFHLIRLQHRLEDLLGRKVDLVPKDGLKPLIRDEVLASARRIYAA
jgi:predicted nucleotidyltransferase